ncbi:hypothetical protein RI129_010611 [Pyrocoelia pectoralis]|uniref:Ionotropic glutamate receptor C-terminal domain-containing protein n=1 Tax=Pyrocoelia pectoralis TaxID=417401 RepID=A0AAN7Z8T8_9COLE
MISALQLIGERNHFNVIFAENTSRLVDEISFGVDGLILGEFNNNRGEIFVSVTGSEYRKCVVLYECTVPLDHEKLYWVIPKPQKKPFWKSVVIAFSSLMWVCLCVSTGLVVITFFCLGLRERSISRAVNFTLRISLGTTAPRPPHSNSSRILFGLYSLSCIVLGTAYLGNLFAYLNNPGFETAITNTREILDSGLPILIQPSLSRLFMFNGPESDEVLDHFIPSTLDENETLYNAALRRDHITISRGGQLTIHPHLRNSFNLLELFFYHAVILVKRDHIYYDFFNYNLRRITETGFYAKWRSDIEIEYFAEPIDMDEHEGPASLSLNQLQGTFFILILGNLVSFTVFLVEVLVVHVSMIWRRNTIPFCM